MRIQDWLGENIFQIQSVHNFFIMYLSDKKTILGRTWDAYCPSDASVYMIRLARTTN
jgi:hypothetical protein